MLNIRRGVIYYSKKLKSGWIVIKVPPIGDAELIASGLSEQEVTKIIEEDNKNVT